MKGMVPNTLCGLHRTFFGERQRWRRRGSDRAEAGSDDRAEAQATEVRIGYLRAYAPQLALSVLDVPPRDDGVAGANVGIGDNNTTGKFLGQNFTLEVTEVKPDAEVVSVFEQLVAKGDRYVLADLSAKQLLSIADLARDKGVLLFNVGSHG